MDRAITRKKLSVLIVDDERAARNRLEDLLARQEDVENIGQASNGREAIQVISDRTPDLVFLDVQMPGLTGLEVVQQVGPVRMPAVIFVTAYDQYAIEAFEIAALDYLLKPFDDERFDQAMARARMMLSLQTLQHLQHRLETLIGVAKPTSSSGNPEPHYLERIGVEMRGQVRVVPVEQVDFIMASSSYAELHVGDETFAIREQIQTLEERLDPNRFFRIHRSTIVQLDRIDSMMINAGGDYAVRLHDGRHLRVSRGRYEDLQRRLGLDTPRIR